MTHVAHPDLHEHGLFDECIGCAEIADNPFGGADDRLLRLLVGQTVDRASSGFDQFATGATLIAQKNILNALERVGRLAEAAPDEVERYLRERWGIRCLVVGRA